MSLLEELMWECVQIERYRVDLLEVGIVEPPIDPSRPVVPHWPLTASIAETGVNVERMAGHADYVSHD